VDGVSPYPRWSLRGVMDNSRICPRRQTDDDARAWLPLYMHYQAGHLFSAGGVSDQPALYLAAMRLIDGAVKESQNG
jgi:hypothetical protein